METLATRIYGIKKAIERENSDDVEILRSAIKDKIAANVEGWIRKKVEKVVIYPQSEFGAIFCDKNYPTHKDDNRVLNETEKELQDFLQTSIGSHASVVGHADRIGEKPNLIVLHFKTY